MNAGAHECESNEVMKMMWTAEIQFFLNQDMIVVVVIKAIGN